MRALWTASEAREATGGELTGGENWQASRVTIDSRAVQPGDLFVALKGERFDGHAYVDDALTRGAVAAVVSEPGPGPRLVVAEPMQALNRLAAARRARTQARVVGLTGSVGKTSAKEMLRLALAPHGSTFASAGNLNNHIGVPLNLANLPLDASYAVLEMGMNHAGEIAHLTRLVRPHAALITTVEAVHLEFFSSVEGIADAKAEIFEGLEPDGVAVLNADNRYYARLAAAARARGTSRIIVCGQAADADCRLLATGEDGSVRVQLAGRTLDYRLGALGAHWGLMSALVLGVVHALGLDPAPSARALEAFAEPQGRGRPERVRLPQGEIWLIDDSYNASPASMAAAFAKTALFWRRGGGGGRKIAALGDMLELGAGAPALHADLAGALATQGFDTVLTAGPLMESLSQALPATVRTAHAADAKSLLPILLSELKSGDVLLLKGSHGSRMYTLAQAIKDHAL